MAGPGPVVFGDEMCWLLGLKAALAALRPFTGVLSFVVFYEFVLHVEFTRPHPTAREIITFKTRMLNRLGGVGTVCCRSRGRRKDVVRMLTASWCRSGLSVGWGLGLEAGGPRRLW